LGFVQESAETGDRICILYGCSVPVVLRKFEKTPAQLREEQAEDEIAHEEQKKEILAESLTRKGRKEGGLEEERQGGKCLGEGQLGEIYLGEIRWGKNRGEEHRPGQILGSH